jgi:hypothetical protein
LNDHAEWFFDRAQDDFDARFLIGVIAFNRACVRACADELYAASIDTLSTVARVSVESDVRVT